MECPVPDRDAPPVLQVIHVDTIVRGIHLLPIFGTEPLLEGFCCEQSLDSFTSFFVNHFIDHHAYEFVKGN